MKLGCSEEDNGDEETDVTVLSLCEPQSASGDESWSCDSVAPTESAQSWYSSSKVASDPFATQTESVIETGWSPPPVTGQPSPQMLQM